MFLEQSQTGTNDLWFVVKTPAGDESVNQLFEMRRYDFALQAPNSSELLSIRP